MFVLDTNVVSEIRKTKSGRANQGVIDWSERVPATLMFLSVISLYELEYGVRRAERSDPAKGEVLREWLDDGVIPAFAERTIPVDPTVSLHAAALHVPDPAPYRNALIGASALVHGMSVVTRDVTDFERFAGLDLVNPWS